ncbi:MAG TPA: winged helix-turn-helix domain-containing protein [Sediminibacterium sp.]|uniref:winged helix-turn-helix domain-containing protein n=1 Tax=Sediminibacterium sp. TaxID=1917865 RepID=UPI0008B77E15|nr:winged helix-turn-helix domain-containing protein [Sediminibacterium sp.]OHC84643.1 MAG: transcriptional regulator [Sphingobacteriia bacterium RIFOXYC2_FULL_35_18]OHC87560.1 MAG: transcriptional regulator [Sphingobacteriia bacterium RIFOXYD2_FULL_35_12]HLD52969.1 winged helix-turn-helix domain-containing protein [Sediminibacterium sp.]
MSRYQKLLNSNRKNLLWVLFLVLTSLAFVAFSIDGDDDFEKARAEILIRKVGHELLLQSDDSVSRVLPLNKISANEYQISFEHEFSFLPDSLINITQRLFGKDQQFADYVVKVLNCSNTSVVYGYAIANNQKDDIVACKGRKLPKDCYVINIQFKASSFIDSKNGYLLGGLPVLAFVGLLYFRSRKPAKTLEQLPTQNNDLFHLGAFLFDYKKRKLIYNENTIDLTGTESRVLRIFALSPNKAIERNKIQKEIWEDEGVIVGRSLDMFISKLRKKLEQDERVRIVVIRGIGYRLEVV